MTTYHPGDILLLKFPFSNEEDAKRRPALVVLDVGDDDVLVARITTRDSKTEYDVALKQWKEAGLKAPSVVRLHKLATLEKSLVERKLGSLAAEDLKAVRELFKKLFVHTTDEESE